MHRRNIVHRDIKLDNILINEIDQDGIVCRIADFGLSKHLPPGTKLYEKCGTPCYVAPEILRDQGYGSKCDIFSLGSLFFNLLTGRFLFKGDNKHALLNANRGCDLRPARDHLGPLTPECVQLLFRLLAVNPD